MLSVIRITVIPKRKNRDSVYLKQVIKLKKVINLVFIIKFIYKFLQTFSSISLNLKKLFKKFLFLKQ